MLHEVKPNVEGIKFTQVGILLGFENMSQNKKKDTDPDYYKITIDLDGEILQTSAWIGCEIEKLQKDIKDVKYKPYKFTFVAAKVQITSRSGSLIEAFKLKVIGIQDATVKDMANDMFK